MRLFKDALMRRSMSAVGALLSSEGEEELHRRTAEVEDAYTRVSERAPEELKGDAAPIHAQVLTALRTKGKGREEALPPRRVLVHILVRLDYYYFELACGYERVHDLPHLTDEERAAEHGLRHDLFLKLYDELEPAFDVSLNWPPGGYEVDKDGELVNVDAEFEGMAAIGYDYGYDAAIFHEGHADDEEYVRGFVEGCLERLIDQDEPEEAEHLGSLWKSDDEEDKRYALDMLKDGCEVREGHFDDQPEFPA
ncbi:MAG: hypothetical protein H0U89_09055 [Acidimicrobiia bacterium]|nr:hypothetical protein [Acidimicrobiia bacterium]